MAVFMIVVTIVAYCALWYFIIKCNRIIKKTDDSGQSSRDIINKQKL